MKKIDKEFIISGICFIILLVMAIITKDVTLLQRIILIVVFFVIVLGIIYLFYFIWKHKEIRAAKKIKKKFDEMKLQGCKTLFQSIYVDVFRKDFNIRLIKELKSNKIANVSNLVSEIVDNGKMIFLKYDYEQFSVLFRLNAYQMEMVVVVPCKYWSLKKEDKILFPVINLEENLTYETFISFLVSIISNVNQQIDEYITNTPIDPIFNGEMYQKLAYFRRYINKNIILSLLSLLLSVLGFLALRMAYNELIEENVKILGVIIWELMMVTMMITLLISIWMGIYWIRVRSHLLKDFEEKQYSIIKEKPRKIKLSITGRSKYQRNMILNYIKLYYNNSMVIIPLMNKQYIVNRKNYRNCLQKLMDLTPNLKALSHSGIVIDGGDKYIKTAIKYISTNK